MFCQNCGVEVTPGSAFCQNCGIKSETGTGSPSQPAYQNQQTPIPPPPAPPIYNQPSISNQPPQANIPPSPIIKQKKRHLGMWIFLSVLVLATAGVILTVGPAIWFGPKDLGIRYTQKDFNRVMKDVGVSIKADFGDGTKYDNTEILNGSETATGYISESGKKAVKIKKLDYKNYNWEFSNYQKKTVRVTQEEATAVLNEIAPPYFWLTDTQVKIEPDKSIKFSSALNIRNIIRDIFHSLADKIPIKLPEKLNIYLEGKFSIKNNTIGSPPTKATSSIYTVPEKYLTDKNIATFVSYFTDLFNELDLKIDVESLTIENGEFVFVGTVPTEVKVTPKDAD